jgi:hypothetical protein
MKTYTVNISSTGPSPSPLSINPGDQVTFQMDNWPVTVTVDFGTSSPFSDHSFQLDGGNQQLAHSTKTALTSADGKYPYNVTTTSYRKGIDPEPMSTPPGEIDVSSTWDK